MIWTSNLTFIQKITSYRKFLSWRLIFFYSVDICGILLLKQAKIKFYYAKKIIKMQRFFFKMC